MMKILVSVLAVVISATTLGCGLDDKAADSAKQIQMPATSVATLASSPLRVVIITDKTASTLHTRTEQVTLGDIQPIFDRLMESGGELRIGSIQENSNKPFLRLRIEQPPTKPLSPDFSENPFERAEQEADWNEIIGRWDRDYERWKVQSINAIDSYKKTVLPQLESPPNRKRTDVYSVLTRSDVALSETHRFRIQPVNVILLATDGEDNVRKHFSGLRSSAKVVVANGDGNIGVLQSLNPEKFESLAAALQFISSLTNWR